ncbi:MAG: hypothetical protein QM661_04840 [Solimonas sp.]
MSLNRLLVVVLSLGVLGWWFSPYSPRLVHAPAGATGGSACPPPPQVAAGGPPLQSDVPASLRPFAVQAATLTPLAGFSIDARVLSREDYAWDREAKLSPTDLALGWGRMADDDVLSRLSLSQSVRFFSYSWKERPPLDPAEIVRSASNMHMIPADDTVARALAAVRKDDRVRIDGWLVQADATDGWRWRSSLSREDSGSGACELVYVCSIRSLSAR